MFANAPTNVVKAFIKELDTREKLAAHYASISTAKLTEVVIGAAGGSAALAGVSFEKLLPFPMTELFGTTSADCTIPTAKLIRKLILSGELPIMFAGAFKDELTAAAS